MKNILLTLFFLLGLSFQATGQTSSSGLEGTWNGTLDAGGTRLRIVVTVTKSDSGVYSAKFESLDQGATVPFDTVTLEGDKARFEVKAAGIVYEAVLNKDRSELSGTFTQGGQSFPLTFTRGGSAAAAPNPTPSPTPSPTPKPDYSAPADAPYTAEDVVINTPAGHKLAGTLTLPKGASRSKPV